MSKQSRAKVVAKAATSAKASAAASAKASTAGCALPAGPNAFLARWGTLLASGIIVLTALAAYHNSFSGPFIWDDTWSITTNPSIHHFGSALSPPPDKGVGGRPLLNLTFALNYALGGMDVWGYHAFNLIIHALAGLLLFGLVRRTLLRPALSGRFGTDALPLALAVAVIWTVHPLQTEAVTYISERAESLMGLFYLLTLYCFIRSQDSGDRIQEKESGCQSPSPDFWLLTPGSWLVASVFSCLLGVMSKEIIATAPLMVLLYDRTFVAGSFREAWRLRWRYYLGLACTWLLLAHLMTGLSQRGIGFDARVTWWIYAFTSCRSVVLYCKLACWPHPLVFDYGAPLLEHVTEAMPYALVLLVLLAAVAMALRYQPVIGFAGAWFFVILAPTSSVIPVAGQPMAEHRLYLSLSAVVALGVLGLHRLLGRRGLLVCAAAAAGLGWLSVERNQDYRSALVIWSDTVAKCPDNERARDNLGNALLDVPGRLPDAIAQFEAALRINPDSVEPHNNLGNALLDVPGRLPDAIAQFEAALRIKPDYAEAHNNLGNALLQIPGRLSEAIAEYETALYFKPDYAEAHYNLGNAFLKSARFAEALGEYKIAIQIKPDYAEAHNNLGNALLQIPGRLFEAIVEYQSAMRIKSDYADAHYNLGRALAVIPGRLPEAIAEYQSALRIKPDDAETHLNLGNALSQIPARLPEAIAEYEAALRIKPDYGEAHNNLGNALSQIPGHLPDAIAQYETALRINPDSVDAHYDLGAALLATPGRLPDAIAQFQAALRLKPDLTPAREILDRLQNPHGLPGASPLDSSVRPE